MSTNIDEFTDTISRITPGGSGTEAINKFNTPISQIESALNTLASRISNQNCKSAVIHKYAPMSSGVYAGCLVYFNTTTLRYEPAVASLLAEPGEQGQSVEAPCARVEGIVLSKDSSVDSTGTVLGTIMCGGYYKDQTAMDGCLGVSATPGTYYLTPDATAPGRAVKDPGIHLRQPVLTYQGDGSFSMSLYYMAHDNHFHGSCVLSDYWKLVTDGVPEGTTAPTDAVFWYNASLDSNMKGIGEISTKTTAVFYKGELQSQNGNFTVSQGYIWYKGEVAPVAGSVTIFNHYPFAYGSAVVRSVESTSDAISVTETNGLIKLTAKDFVSGSSNYSALAISSVSGNVVGFTPVISGLSAGPGTNVTLSTNGTAVISARTIIGAPIDAYNINHNGTNLTSDGTFLYFTFPSSRSAALVMSMPVTSVSTTDVIRAYAWGNLVGTGASFSVDYYFIAQTTAGNSIPVPATPTSRSTWTASGQTGYIAYTEDSEAGGVTFTGPGMLMARVTISNAPTTDIRFLRMGFRLTLVDSEIAQAEVTKITEVTAVTYKAIAAGDISKYDTVQIINTASGSRLSRCGCDNISNCDKCVGVAVTGGATGAEITYAAVGIVDGAASTFTPGLPVYISTAGKLTQTDPATTAGSLFIQRIGTALSSTAVQINIEPGFVKG